MTTSTEEQHLRRLARRLDGREMFTLVFMVHDEGSERDRIAQRILDEAGGEIVWTGPDDKASTTALLERLAGEAPPVRNTTPQTDPESYSGSSRHVLGCPDRRLLANSRIPDPAASRNRPSASTP